MQILSLGPGITLRCIPDDRFKHGCLSIQLVRPMCREEAALNALIPAVLLRGSESCPDLRRITLRLDDLYGASVGAEVRRVGDYQTTGLYASFMDDRFAFAGEQVFAPLAAFLKELLRCPLLENGVFPRDFVESEKKNLIATIEAQRNDKQAYASRQLLRHMCSGDSYGIPRLGEAEWVARITPEEACRHYQKLLRESRIEIFYAGSQPPERVAEEMEAVFEGIQRNYVNLPPQMPLHPSPGGEFRETMEVSQGKLCMGFTAPCALEDQPVMQLLSQVLGGDQTGKLFTRIREEQSLCYAISTGYSGCKGIFTVSAGIDSAMEQTVRREVLNQLDACREGKITARELHAAKQAMRSSLLGIHDSPGAMEYYYATNALSGWDLTPDQYIRAVEAVSAEQLADAARQVSLHSVYFLKGVEA